MSGIFMASAYNLDTDRSVAIIRAGHCDDNGDPLLLIELMSGVSTNATRKIAAEVPYKWDNLTDGMARARRIARYLLAHGGEA